MKFCRARINIYLTAAFTGVIAAWLGCGCKTAEQKKSEQEFTAASFHMETPPDGTPRTKTISVLRSSPVELTIQTSPFLDGLAITNAAVIDTIGGHALEVQFDRRGSAIFEAATTSYKGRRIAISVRFPELRWLAAPRISSAVKGGKFSFTADASREECDRIVRGLLNAYRDRTKKSKTWGLTPDE